MQSPGRSILVALTAVAACTAAAAVEPAPQAKREVEQLLAVLETSGCRFRRNGTWHSAAEARAHLEMKYRYLLDKQMLGTPEDFIALAAAKSETTAQLYWVKCGAQAPVQSAAWLAARLKELRSTARPAGASDY